jgi:hypothetical protein
VLAFDPLLPPAEGGLLTEFLEVFQFLFHRLRFHGAPPSVNPIAVKRRMIRDPMRDVNVLAGDSGQSEDG